MKIRYNYEIPPSLNDMDKVKIYYNLPSGASGEAIVSQVAIDKYGDKLPKIFEALNEGGSNKARAIIESIDPPPARFSKEWWDMYDE